MARAPCFIIYLLGVVHFIEPLMRIMRAVCGNWITGVVVRTRIPGGRGRQEREGGELHGGDRGGSRQKWEAPVTHFGLSQHTNLALFLVLPGHGY
jgi:hypothetical protein